MNKPTLKRLATSSAAALAGLLAASCELLVPLDDVMGHDDGIAHEAGIEGDSARISDASFPGADAPPRQDDGADVAPVGAATGADAPGSEGSAGGGGSGSTQSDSGASDSAIRADGSGDGVADTGLGGTPRLDASAGDDSAGDDSGMDAGGGGHSGSGGRSGDAGQGAAGSRADGSAGGASGHGAGGGSSGAGDASRADVGCSDGAREAYKDNVTFPDIAGCLGTWNEGGMRDTKTGKACGNNLAVTCAVPADLCASGWHVCGTPPYGPADVRSKLSQSDCLEGATGFFLMALGDQACDPCDVDHVTGESGVACCGASCTQQNGNCVYPNATAWFGVVENHVNYCHDVINKWSNVGALCCRD